MLSITAVFGPHQSRLCISLEAQGRSKISTRWEDCAGSSPVLPMLSEGLEIELSDFKTENATLKRDYLRQGVEIVIGGVSTILAVRFMSLFMSLGRLLLQGSVPTSLFNPMRYQVDFWTVEVSI
jgi:hypothetical protein